MTDSKYRIFCAKCGFKNSFNWLGFIVMILAIYIISGIIGLYLEPKTINESRGIQEIMVLFFGNPLISTPTFLMIYWYTFKKKHKCKQ